MKNILIDENGDYGLECTNAVWASDQMHQDYHTAKVPLADADFLLEDEKFIMIVEYKNCMFFLNFSFFFWCFSIK